MILISVQLVTRELIVVKEIQEVRVTITSRIINFFVPLIYFFLPLGPLSFDVSFETEEDDVRLKKGKLTYLYGVVSTGIGCGSAIPGIYTKVNRYLDWIEKEMNLME